MLRHEEDKEGRAALAGRDVGSPLYPLPRRRQHEAGGETKEDHAERAVDPVPLPEKALPATCENSSQ